eukprot:11196454-Lingulodinium_polyedra.AAC.1
MADARTMAVLTERLTSIADNDRLAFVSPNGSTISDAAQSKRLRMHAYAPNLTHAKKHKCLDLPRSD